MHSTSSARHGVADKHGIYSLSNEAPFTNSNLTEHFSMGTTHDPCSASSEVACPLLLGRTAPVDASEDKLRHRRKVEHQTYARMQSSCVCTGHRHRGMEQQKARQQQQASTGNTSAKEVACLKC